ncbi:MAG: hypothetical protein IMZ67_02015 [Acidobacteria bacterium]|nr:hypothetical protein [Acidobacteriota bacterium]
MRRFSPFFATLFALMVSAAWASAPGPGFRMEVLVDGRAVAQYHARGTVYVEALKGRDYAIRLHNPLAVRVAVALSVDGLNTIDARRTSASDARKWVLDPDETVTISGWQTDMSHARRFYFTTEQESYAQWLGKTDNMGVISAVFFRERVARIDPIVTAPIELGKKSEAQGAAAGAAGKEPARRDAPAPSAAAQASSAPVRAADEYAATGIGDQTDHAVRRIQMDLEASPVTSLGVRYEFRPQLVRLGVLPPAPTSPDPLTRREGARGFDERFCPAPLIRRW